MLVQMNINNVPKNINAVTNYGEYLVVRNCDNELWYYGIYEEELRAQSVAKEIGNGIVVRIWR